MNTFKPTRLMTSNNFVNRAFGLDGSLPYRLKIGMTATVVPSLIKAAMIEFTDLSPVKIAAVSTAVETITLITLDMRGKRYYNVGEHILQASLTFANDYRYVDKKRNPMLDLDKLRAGLAESLANVKLGPQ